MRRAAVLVALACELLALVGASASLAARPLNRDDPCSRAGRDTCGTLGVGYYREYRYGIRWFGDFRRAIAGEPLGFCLDLGYWYASPRHRYRLVPGSRLVNRDGEVVPVERQRRLAYAVWRYGRSANADRQAAVALYVHSLMGDAQPGEVDPAALDAPAAALFRRIERDSARHHGPYRVQTRFSRPLMVGETTTVSIRMLSARGVALPGIRLALSASGATNVPASAQTNSSGLARVRLTPAAAGRLHLAVRSGPVPSTLPRVFAATRGQAAENAQRLAAPGSQRVTANASGPVHAQPAIGTAVSYSIVRTGGGLSTRVHVRGLGRTPARLRIELHGPFATRSAIRCNGRPYASRTVAVHGDSDVHSPVVRIGKAGFYSYRERLSGSALVRATTTRCAQDGSTALAAPRILAGRATTRRAAAAPSTPMRVRLPAVDIDAAVRPVGIDLATGALRLPADIGRAGWWRDGSAPGAAAGAVLISGHVDSARDGAGAFFALHRAKPGQRVLVRAANGRTYSYRVVSVRSYPKSALPLGIYSTTGAPRLVLVTCGGPFDATTHSYRDNVVVAAVPA